jgi:hypothetical protein
VPAASDALRVRAEAGTAGNKSHVPAFIAPHSPWQNSFVERVIGSIRRECPDHVIVWNEAHLRRLLAAHADYYNTSRTHLSLGKDAPEGRAVEREGTIVARSILGGLHHRYGRCAGAKDSNIS